MEKIVAKDLTPDDIIGKLRTYLCHARATVKEEGLIPGLEIILRVNNNVNKPYLGYTFTRDNNTLFQNFITIKTWISKIISYSKVIYVGDRHFFEDRFLSRTISEEVFEKFFKEFDMLTNDQRVQFIKICLAPSYINKNWSMIWGVLELLYYKKPSPFTVSSLNGTLHHGLNRILIVCFKLYNEKGEFTNKLYENILDEFLQVIQERSLSTIIRSSLRCFNTINGYIIDIHSRQDVIFPHDIISEKKDEDIEGVLEKKKKGDGLLFISNNERRYGPLCEENHLGLLVTKLLNNKCVKKYRNGHMAAIEALRIFKINNMKDRRVLRKITTSLRPKFDAQSLLIKDLSVNNLDILNVDNSDYTVYIGTIYVDAETTAMYLTHKKSGYDRVRYTNVSGLLTSTPFYKSLKEFKDMKKPIKNGLFEFAVLDGDFDSIGALVFDLLRDRISSTIKKIIDHYGSSLEVLLNNITEEQFKSTRNSVGGWVLEETLMFIETSLYKAVDNIPEHDRKLVIDNVLFYSDNMTHKLIQVLPNKDLNPNTAKKVGYINDRLFNIMRSTLTANFYVNDLDDYNNFSGERDELVRIVNILLIDHLDFMVTRNEILESDVYKNNNDFWNNFYKDKEYTNEPSFWDIPVGNAIDITIRDILTKKNIKDKYYKFDSDANTYYEFSNRIIYMGKVLKQDYSTDEKLTQLLFEDALKNKDQQSILQLPGELVPLILNITEAADVLMSNWENIFPYYGIEEKDTIIFFSDGVQYNSQWCKDFVKKFDKKIGYEDIIPTLRFDTATEEYSLSDGEKFYFKKQGGELLGYQNNMPITVYQIEQLVNHLDIMRLKYSIVKVPILNGDTISIIISAKNSVIDYNTCEEMLYREYYINSEVTFNKHYIYYTNDDDVNMDGDDNLFLHRPFFSAAILYLKNQSMDKIEEASAVKEIALAMNIDQYRRVIFERSSYKPKQLIAVSDITLPSGSDSLWVEIDNYEEIKRKL